MGLFGHLNNSSVAFAMYIHVHFKNRANTIIIFEDCLIQLTFVKSKNKIAA